MAILEADLFHGYLSVTGRGSHGAPSPPLVALCDNEWAQWDTLLYAHSTRKLATVQTQARRAPGLRRRWHTGASAHHATLALGDGLGASAISVWAAIVRPRLSSSIKPMRTAHCFSKAHLGQYPSRRCESSRPGGCRGAFRGWYAVTSSAAGRGAHELSGGTDRCLALRLQRRVGVRAGLLAGKTAGWNSSPQTPEETTVMVSS